MNAILVQGHHLLEPPAIHFTPQERARIRKVAPDRLTGSARIHTMVVLFGPTTLWAGFEGFSAFSGLPWPEFHNIENRGDQLDAKVAQI
jgi:hypothetical protein